MTSAMEELLLNQTTKPTSAISKASRAQLSCSLARLPNMKIIQNIYIEPTKRENKKIERKEIKEQLRFLCCLLCNRFLVFSDSPECCV